MDFFNTADFNLENYLKESYGSVDVLIAGAKRGEQSSQIYLGIAYCEGIEGFVEKDTKKAIGWLDTAVENSCVLPSVIQKLGQLLDLTGELHNQRKAYALYHKAARLGSTPAQLHLAEMYRCGVEGVVSEDIKEAFEWYKIAAGESTVDYSTEMGSLGLLIAGTTNKIENYVYDYRHKALTSLYNYYLLGDCPEGKPQPTKAVNYLTRAAELGNNEAQLNLGKIYLNGSCEQIKDFRKAKRWLEKASVSGDVVAEELLRQCQGSYDTKHDTSEVSEEAFEQSFDVMNEKLRHRDDVDKHPFAIVQPVSFSEKMLQRYEYSPTARIHLKAYKLVKEGLEILHRSDFTDERGLSLIAYGYLTENSILQAFPHVQTLLLPKILQLCKEMLFKNPCFFEGLLLAFALRYKTMKRSDESYNCDTKALMCLMNLINFIQKKEPKSHPCEEPFEFDKNYSSWLHVLHYHLATIYTLSNAMEQAAEAFENSVKCCPSYYDAKRGLGYSMVLLYASHVNPERKISSHRLPKDLLRPINWQPHSRHTAKYESWTAEMLRDTAMKVIKEYLMEAPACDKNYPNAYYYLANIAIIGGNMDDFRKYFELGQDAEEKRLPFFNPIDLPLKDMMVPHYHLLSNVIERARCGNKSCVKDVQESD